MKNPTMLKVLEMEGEIKSFKLIPVSAECPFLEARFHSETKVLRIVSKHNIDKFDSLPKLDSNGNIKPSKVNKEGICFERVKISFPYDYAVTNRTDIEAIVNILCGPTDLSEYFKVSTPEPTLSKVD